MKKLILLVFLLIITLPAAAQRDWSEVEIKSQKVAGNVWMLTGAGGNLGVSVGEDGMIVIDDQYAPLAPKIKEALAALSDSDVLYVLNTHWHGDHTGGNEAFGEMAPIVAHHNVRKRLAEGMSLPGHQVEPAPEAALPVLTFGKDLTLHYNGESIRAIHLPHGHTDGDTVVWFPESNVVHMGDHYFQGRFPYIDLDSGGSVHGFIRNIETVLEMVPSEVQLIPGHGALSNTTELREHLAMLKATTGVIAKALAAGKTVEQMKEEKILAEWDENSWAFISTDRFIEIVARDLSNPQHEMHDHGEGHRRSHKE